MSDKKGTLEIILDSKEWQVFECKRAEAKPAKVLESIVAIANAEGGSIVIGLEDPEKQQGEKRLLGISENPDNVSELMNLIPKEITPPLQNLRQITLPIKNINGKDDNLLLLLIDRSAEVHSLRSGDTYLRYGRTNRRLTAEQIIKLKYAKGSISYEAECAPGILIEDLDVSLIEKFKGYTGSTETNTWQFLKDNGLLAKKNNKDCLNNACVLLFAKNPSVTLKRKCGIKIIHYYGTKPVFTGNPNFLKRPLSVEGSLLLQIKETLKYLIDWIKNAPPKLEGSAFKSKMKYPEWVLQEAVTNAVIHRDYSIQDDIQIRIFDNRIEIESPGILPGSITVSNIKKERFARNPIILRTLNRFGTESPNLDIGEGVNRMFQLMKQANLYDPIYLVPPTTSNSVMLLLPNMERISYWDSVSKYLDEKYRLTNKELRHLTGITDTLKATRLLKDLVKKGLLEEVKPSKKTTYYCKPGVRMPTDLFSQGYENKKGKQTKNKKK